MSGKRSRCERAAAYLRQPYVQKLNAAVAKGAIPMIPGSVGHLRVAHDDWCPLLKNSGLCCCSPELSLSWAAST
jgi:hypothetical protein